MIDTTYIADLTDPRRPLLTLPVFQFSDIFPINVSYRGSSFQIQEIATIDLLINNPRLIDVDLNYYEPNRFLGSWQVFRFTGEVVDGKRGFFSTGTNEPTFQGRIVTEQLKLSRISTHTIGDSSGSSRTTTQFIINPCNTDIIPALIRPGDGTGGLIQGFKFGQTEAIFTGFNYEIVPELLDEPFFGQLEAIGLYISPGATFVSAQYKVSVINVLNQLGDEYPGVTCVTESVDCVALLRQELAGSTLIFATEAECRAFNPGGCISQDYFLGGECGLVQSWVEGAGPP